MQIKTVFNDNEILTVNSYLQKCGIIDIEEYINPSGKYLDNWSDYNNIDIAVQMFDKHIQNNSNIIMIQDCDVDGICSCFELYDYIKTFTMFENINIEILFHTSKQRGLEDEDIMNNILNSNCNLVIITDAGTCNREYAEILKEYNIDLLVLDHHNFIEEKVNEWGVIVNNQDILSNVQRDGSGALVTHKFLQALDVKYQTHRSGHYIDLVALSLVADSMDMTSMENRVYYHFGIETIEDIHNAFLKALFLRFIGDKPYTQRDIAFKVVPKLNAICRSNDMELKDKLFHFFSETELYGTHLEEIMKVCEKAHANQIATVNDILENNIDNIDNSNNIVIFASDDIPRSYSGLVCGKIMSLTNKPSVVGSVKDNYFIGSMRSPIEIQETLNNCEYVDFCSGHPNSAGIGFDFNNVDDILDYFNSLNLNYEPCIKVLQSYSINNTPNNIYGLFEPFNHLWGKGIEIPKIHIKKFKINSSTITELGKTKRTLKFSFNGVSFLIFNCTNKNKQDLHIGENKDIYIECIGTPTINEWNGRKYNQIIVDNFEVSNYEKSIENIF